MVKFNNFYAHSRKSISIFIKLAFEVNFTLYKLMQIFTKILFAGQTLKNLSKLCKSCKASPRESFSP